MPAEVIRMRQGEGRTHVIIECDQLRFQLVLRPTRDLNGQISGYHSWLRRDGSVFATEQEAIAAALRAVDRLVLGVMPVA